MSSLQVLIVVIALVGGLGCAAPPSPKKPAITSTPVKTAAEDQLYLYDVASNVEGRGGTTYTLPTAPAGMTIHPATGVVSWTPTNAQVGLSNVTVRVTDGSGGAASQTFTVAVANRPPTIITATPCIWAKVGTQYLYNVESDDEGQGATSYSLTQAPVGMQINAATGVITWTPTNTDMGSHTVKVEVDDGHGGGKVMHTFTLTVTTAGTRADVNLDGRLLATLGPTATMDITGPDPTIVGLSTDRVHDLQLLTCTLYRLTSVVAGSPQSSVTIAVTGGCQAIVAP